LALEVDIPGMANLLFHIISGILGLYLASRFVPGVEFNGSVKSLLIVGAALGLANFFIKPILKAVTLPIRIITFGLFSLVINLLMVWIVVDILFPTEFELRGFLPLLWTTLIIWVLNFIFGLRSAKK